MQYIDYDNKINNREDKVIFDRRQAKSKGSIEGRTYETKGKKRPLDNESDAISQFFKKRKLEMSKQSSIHFKEMTPTKSPDKTSVFCPWGNSESLESEEKERTYKLLQELNKSDEQSIPTYQIKAFSLAKNFKFKNKEHIENSLNTKLKYITQGSFHEAYKIGDRVIRVIKSDLDKQFERRSLYLSAEKTNVPYSAYITYNGYISYKRLAEEIKNIKGLKIANLFNNPLVDGYWEVEYVPNEVNLKDDKQKKVVIECLKKMKEDNHFIFPDFRPSNVKADKNGNVVIIDFCEDKSIDQYKISVDKLVEEYIEEWANGDNYLREELSINVNSKA